MPDWVLAAERAYVAAAVGPAARAAAEPSVPATASRVAHAVAAAGAVASHYLAVGSPRSFGIVIDDGDDAAAAALSLVAHRTWFAPRDIRCAATTGGADALAAATGGRAVSVDEALACDIVALHAVRLRVGPSQLRRGTHVNAVATATIAPELLALATIVHEAGLPALAAGLVDGRQLDELTIFFIDGAAIAAAAMLAG